MKWFIQQVREPTAWLCTILFFLVLFNAEKWVVLTACVIGVLLDETWMKLKCEELAPKLSAKLDEWTKDI